MSFSQEAFVKYPLVLTLFSEHYYVLWFLLSPRVCTEEVYNKFCAPKDEIVQLDGKTQHL